MFSSLIYIGVLIVFIYLSVNVLYLFLFSLAGKYFYRKHAVIVDVFPEKRIAILVPAYREDGIILSTARNLLQQAYPKELFDVYIIADSFQKETLDQLRWLPVQVLEVQFDSSTKTKALNEAFRRINHAYDIALICDADNMLAKDVLSLINQAFVHGARAVQAKRVAKNTDTSFAVLDACSEAINNHIFRRGANALGLSSAVIGSGMAFDFSLLHNSLLHIAAVGGFDKVLQLDVVKQGITIQYLEAALVFDEKVSSSQAFRQQRKRWMASQLVYLKKYLPSGIAALCRGNLSYFNLAVMNNLVLPRVFLLAILPFMVLLCFFFQPAWLVWSMVLCTTYLLSLVIALPAALINRQLGMALLSLPKAAAGMFTSLLQLKKANKRFIHTVHTQTEITNPIFNKHGQ